MDSNLEKIKSILKEIQVSIEYGYKIKKFILNETKYKSILDSKMLGCPVEFDSKVEDVKIEVFGGSRAFFI